MGRSRGPRPKRPTEAEQKKMKAAIYDKHWGMRPNCAGVKTDGNGYACLIADSLDCGVFTKHINLVNHMLDYHHLIAGKPPRGRPVTSDRVRKPMSQSSLLKQKDNFLGRFPLRMWVLKKNHMQTSLKWALNAHTLVNPKGDKWKWIVSRAEGVYRRWREGTSFTDNLKTTLSTISEYWDEANRERNLGLTAESIQKKV